jgi:adenosylhomocysteine nucleosidase
MSISPFIPSSSSQKYPTLGVIDTTGLLDSMIESKGFFSDIPHRKLIGVRSFLSGRIKGVPVVIGSSGWGKVASAVTTALLLSHFQIDYLVLIGFCGSLKPHVGIGDIVIGTECVHHDFDARPLFDQYEIPLLGISFFSSHVCLRQLLSASVDKFLLESGSEIKDKLHGKGGVNPRKFEGLIATRDQFLDSQDQVIDVSNELPQALVVDMEGASCAQVAYEYKTPFVSVKIVANSSDPAAALDLHEFIRSGANLYSYNLLHSLIDMIKGHSIAGYEPQGQSHAIASAAPL